MSWGVIFHFPIYFFLVKITIHRKMDAHQATLRVCVALHSGPHRFFHDWLKWTLRKQASRLFFKKFSMALDLLRSLFSLWSFFVNNSGKKIIVLKLRRSVFYFQEIDVWILIKQSQNTLSIFSQVYWPLWFCVQTSIFFTCTLYWQFFANFFVRV